MSQGQSAVLDRESARTQTFDGWQKVSSRDDSAAQRVLTLVSPAWAEDWDSEEDRDIYFSE
jgi:hypothetical protein